MEQPTPEDIERARRLCALTNGFYRAQAASFSDTRRDPWPGWRRVIEEIGWMPGGLQASGGLGASGWSRTSGEPGASGGSRGAARPCLLRPLRVLDLGCGNLRFERFLCDALPEARFAFHAVDACDELAGPARASLPADRASVCYQGLDVCGGFAEGRSLAKMVGVPDRSCDLAVAFGFMHHVPLAAWRAEVLRELARKVRPGGFVAASFWRFMDSPKLARKAVRETARALAELPGVAPRLCEGDYLLGWQGKPGAFRYCHHFPDDEVEGLVRAVAPAAAPAARFRADGAPGNLNSYVVLRVKEMQTDDFSNMRKTENCL